MIKNYKKKYEKTENKKKMIRLPTSKNSDFHLNRLQLSMTFEKWIVLNSTRQVDEKNVNKVYGCYTFQININILYET